MTFLTENCEKYLTLNVQNNGINDAKDIADIYDIVSINEIRADKKLSSTSKLNFKKTGGIFKSFDKNELSIMLSSGKYGCCTSKINDSTAAFLIWEYNPNTNDLLKIEFTDDKVKDTVNKAISNNKIFSALDYAQNPDFSKTRIIYPTFYEMYKQMYDKGYEYCFFEIYTISAFRYNNKDIDVDLPNIKSIKQQENYGVEYIGCREFEKIIGKKYEVKIKSGYYIVNVRNAILNLEKVFEQKGIKTLDKSTYSISCLTEMSRALHCL